MKDLIAKHYKPSILYKGGFVNMVGCNACESLSEEYAELSVYKPCPNCGSRKVFNLKHAGRYRNGKWEIFTPEKLETRRNLLRKRAGEKLRALYDAKLLPALKKYCPFIEFDEKLK